ncbi:hypothetical protein ACFE04_017601 [Oxalis oulophora]
MLSGLRVVVVMGTVGEGGGDGDGGGVVMVMEGKVVDVNRTGQHTGGAIEVSVAMRDGGIVIVLCLWNGCNVASEGQRRQELGRREGPRGLRKERQGRQWPRVVVIRCVSSIWRVKNKVRNGGRERELRLEIVGKESGEGSIPSWWRWRRLCGNGGIGGGGGERSGYSFLQLEIVSKIKVGFKVFGCR